MKNYGKINSFNENVLMPSEGTKLLKFNQYQKSHKTPFIIYADLECLIENIYGRKNNPAELMHKNIFHQVSQYLRYLHLKS